MEQEELGRYSLHEHLGRGSVARVYRATDNETGNVVAPPDDIAAVPGRAER